ncbi:single-stranded DNA-binding protein [Mycoplasma sp. 'Moose RK']|uniref:single-stranded DNA-binding protein n=1 Tax=Mycoplasma sp. 'Moose RK' TaxID=2780095 RepID=UPI0018C2D808|nr:single-stranded DNA-binding protein [Mycoplasma sp. 'Moose RK']MBG0730686.1 single-stranded DNA-binding protein [Mycoplasma sp. 'Moose RK']
MNRIILIGRISSRPTFLTTKSEIPFIRFSLAVSRRRYSQDATPITDFIPIVAWRQNAVLLDKLATVGTLIAIEGSLQSNRVISSTNAYLTNYEVHVENFETLETKEQLEMRRQKLTQRIQNPTFESPLDSFDGSARRKQVSPDFADFSDEAVTDNRTDSLEDPLADWDIDALDPENLE